MPVLLLIYILLGCGGEGERLHATKELGLGRCRRVAAEDLLRVPNKSPDLWLGGDFGGDLWLAQR